MLFIKEDGLWKGLFLLKKAVLLQEEEAFTMSLDKEIDLFI